MNVATEHPAGRLRQLLAAVPTTSAPPIMADEVPSGRHCVVCHRGGNLGGGHHDDGGRVVWIHKACHRPAPGRTRSFETLLLWRLDHEFVSIS